MNIIKKLFGKKEVDEYEIITEQIHEQFIDLYAEVKVSLIVYTDLNSKINLEKDKICKKYNTVNRNRIKKDFPDNIKRLRILNSPRISSDEIERWNKKINDLEEDGYELMGITKKGLK